MSKYQFRQSDIYYQGTDVPINHLGITDPELLHEVESELLQQAYQTFVEALDGCTRFDEKYFLSLHQCTFESLYSWAGQYRIHDMAKGGSLFCRASYLPNEARRIFAELEKEHFLCNPRNGDKTYFANRLAYFKGEIIALHPFYELNGRITRLFFDLIAIANGYNPIDYGLSLVDDPEVQNNYIRASIYCVRQADTALLRDIIYAGLNLREITP